LWTLAARHITLLSVWWRNCESFSASQEHIKERLPWKWRAPASGEGDIPRRVGRRSLGGGDSAAQCTAMRCIVTGSDDYTLCAIQPLCSCSSQMSCGHLTHRSPLPDNDHAAIIAFVFRLPASVLIKTPTQEGSSNVAVVRPFQQCLMLL